MAPGDDQLSLHAACYLGRLDRAAQLLANGADPNEPADPNERVWVSCAGNRPRPLNCVAIAWAIGDDHVKIAALLIRHGAVVDESVLQDHTVEMVGSPRDEELRRVLTTTT